MLEILQNTAIITQQNHFSTYAIVYCDGGTTPPAPAPTPAQPGAPTPATTTASPQMGDGNSMGLWIALLITAALGLAAALGARVLHRRVNKNRGSV